MKRNPSERMHQACESESTEVIDSWDDWETNNCKTNVPDSWEDLVTDTDTSVWYIRRVH